MPPFSIPFLFSWSPFLPVLLSSYNYIAELTHCHNRQCGKVGYHSFIVAPATQRDQHLYSPMQRMMQWRYPLQQPLRPGKVEGHHLGRTTSLMHSAHHPMQRIMYQQHPGGKHCYPYGHVKLSVCFSLPCSRASHVFSSGKDAMMVRNALAVDPEVGAGYCPQCVSAMQMTCFRHCSADACLGVVRSCGQSR